MNTNKVQNQNFLSTPMHIPIHIVIIATYRTYSVKFILTPMFTEALILISATCTAVAIMIVKLIVSRERSITPSSESPRTARRVVNES